MNDTSFGHIDTIPGVPKGGVKPGTIDGGEPVGGYDIDGDGEGG